MNQPFTSIHYPLAVDKGTGEITKENNYSAHIEQLLKQVLLTNPGERVNRADFGCGIRQMVFAPNSDVTASLTQITILQALDRWLSSVVETNHVKVNALNEILEIRIVYTIKSRQERKYLNLEVAL